MNEERELGLWLLGENMYQAEGTRSTKALKQEDCEQNGEGGGPRCQVSWAMVRSLEIF